LGSSRCYCVAGQNFKIETNGNSQLFQCLSSFEPFFLKEDMEKSKLLFSLEVCNSEQIRKDVTVVKDFSIDGATYHVARIPGGGYQYRLTWERDLSACSVMDTNSDFSQVRVFLDGTSFFKRYSFNNFLMIAYAFAAASEGILLIHSSVIMHKGKGYLFSGKSGTGKSTHSRLWLENIEDTELLNDDNPVVRLENGKVFVYGSPWSGKTPCYKNKSVPVGAFVRLSQKPKNEIAQCGTALAYASLLPSFSNMIWDDRVNDAIATSISKIVISCPVYKLGCLPNREAAFLCHDTIGK